MIQTQNLTFKYKNQKTTIGFPDIHLKENEHLLILGKSGIGKTTLLHLLAGLLKPETGNLTINNTNINTLSSSKLDKFRGKNVGLVFQQKHAIQSLSVIENLQARLFFSNKKENQNKLNDLLEQLNLTTCKNNKINQISEGQLQRLGIALSVVHNPQVILADEPTSSLDDENCEAVINLLKQQAEKNKAHLIVITHDQRIKSFFENTMTL
ncbi:ATP-binding cassette domain-containing protein [Neotamlana laminarinivorans]|uniref:ATP-binding cassette domain-containing protein n=1 Tax=Neotamlana laminarinivorans TaxID=2883124 RepID=A0A9X1L0D1_9FLAO|nr:ATP-binding cassette domain-containing protein [Tamlana laminarinivorans]MCB4797340.1 ATP-binding cassette domain-containing protein [Tamlana laminarinivorans]